MKKIIIFTLLINLIASGLILVQTASADTELKQVDSKYVCMITNKLFADEQIEVDIEGKKYYGCCQMCKGRLEHDLASRTALDPISGNSVDKATAVIGVAPNKSVYYFESEDNFEKFNKTN